MLIEGNDKYWARTRVLAKLVDLLSKELGYTPGDPIKKNKKCVGGRKS
jgi:hypothetical protein